MQTVKVRLRKPNRVFTFLSNNIPLARDDRCVVRSDRGLEYGVCVISPEDCTAEEQARFKMNVIRKSTAHDDKTLDEIKSDEERASKTCLEKIRDRGLAMKFVDSEYSFDRKKITFYFTAEDRVDFRQLVRDLAQDLKARIELRHIQVRDEAKMVGGIGTCGRELCCTTWIKEFVPISMKMAKRQSLSLNPSKISGQCGRLMCCLWFENDQYSKAKRSNARPVPKDPDNLSRIRDKMEADAPAAAKVLSETTLKDDKMETSGSRPRNGGPRNLRGRRPARRGAPPQPGTERQKTVDGAAPPGDSQSTAPSESKPAAKRSRGKRRRRRKRPGDGPKPQSPPS